MISCTEFIPLYSELFKFLHKKKGKEEVLNYWNYVSDNYVQPLLGSVVEKGGIKGCFDYWSKSLNEENCDFTIIYDEDEESFQIKMYGCPSKGMLNDMQYTNPYPDYCGHCAVLYSRVLEKYGLTKQFDFSNVANAKCESLCSYIGKEHANHAHVIKYDRLFGLRLELINQPKMLEFIKSANADTPCGKHDFEGEGYINVIETSTSEKAPELFEVHKEYYDVHCLLSGKERIYFDLADKMQLDKPYNKDIEASLFKTKNKPSFIDYEEGEAIAIKNDTAHACVFAVDKSIKIKKAIIKILV